MGRDTTQELTIYLAGTLNDGWREKVKERLEGFNVKVYDPVDLSLQPAGVFVEEELRAAATCDLTFAYIAPNDPSTVGTMSEITMAFNAGKPVFLVHEGVAPHPFMTWMAHLFRTNLDAGLKALEMYLIGDDGYIHTK